MLFNFSFGSEEYQEFVGSDYNEAFAICLSGPGFDVPTNVAALPNGRAPAPGGGGALIRWNAPTVR